MAEGILIKEWILLKNASNKSNIFREKQKCTDF
jgi:hypothetical protein